MEKGKEKWGESRGGEGTEVGQGRGGNRDLKTVEILGKRKEVKGVNH